MQTNVIPLPTTAAIDAAWERYTDLARGVIDNPSLLLDRKHAQAIAEAHEAWRVLYLAQRRT